MRYELAFKPKALKEWKRLDLTIREQLKKKLAKRLEDPKVSKDKLRGYDNIYKIKLRFLIPDCETGNELKSISLGNPWSGRVGLPTSIGVICAVC